VVQFENSHKGLSFRSAALSREESAVFLLAASRFLADKPGFGMTRGGVFLRKLHHDPDSTRFSPETETAELLSAGQSGRLSPRGSCF
jgi:hypothetical protein